MTKDLTQIKSKIILLDTNIIIHYASDGFLEKSGNPLRVLYDNENKIIISSINRFELLKNENKPDRLRKYEGFLDNLPEIIPKTQHFMNAAIIAGDYRKFCNQKKVPEMDLLLAGIIAANTPPGDPEKAMLLLTADRNDFREPIWQTLARVVVGANDRSHDTVVLYLLRLDINLLLGTD